ncbi:ArsR/SmtB family transcription factor [Cellulomonas carbonis]|uniref:ArsR family transcriptional regulator n=1 Tax=Cellulomonas carbonis T26 TaxID=947969 RepID=A0A0A0BZ68_9CELL|nr:metalloregulator ArsR/SmtB family transcription factor [Cellulomonas carbonis]KGM12479.1 ArsR family transcriptional regulator [Cellulomonas carbonis T26]GGC15617.1 transcriptional regulator [Cellulomonas carbonis]
MPLQDVLSALADPTRRAVVEALRPGGLTVGELARQVLTGEGMSAPAFSKHLRVLEAAGVVRRDRVGRTVVVTLEPSSLDELATWVESTTRHWSRTIDRLDRYLEQEDA